uniref:Ig-like domain-containing protein n=1 Tax=Oryctolagus cuniculus TaxID=9986 RepID=A0A0B4J1Q5_RABIT
MLWTVALLVAVLSPGSQTSSNSEKTMTVVTKPTGSSVTVTCSIPQQSGYIHWYRFQEGKAPQRLLYYDFSISSSIVDSGFSPVKYHAFRGTKICNFVLQNLEESDSGVYYCASATGTVIPTCFVLHAKNCLWFLLVLKIGQSLPHFRLSTPP